MEHASPSRNNSRPRFFAAIILILAALSVAGVFWRRPTDYSEVPRTIPYRIVEIVAMLSPIVLLRSAIGVILKQGKWYAIGLAGGLAALSWFAWTEHFRFEMVNSWIALNLSETGGALFFGFICFVLFPFWDS